MITEKITGMSLMPEEAKKTTSRRETEALHNRGCRAGLKPPVSRSARAV